MYCRIIYVCCYLMVVLQLCKGAIITNNITGFGGETTSVVCSSTNITIGDTYQWRKNNIVIYSRSLEGSIVSDKYIGTTQAGSLTLNILLTSISDEGQYKCTHKFESASATVYVAFKPERVTATIIRDTGLTLSLTAIKVYPNTSNINQVICKNVISLKETRIHVKNHPCGTVGAKIAYVLAFLVHGIIVGVFGRIVFFVDCLLSETLNMATETFNGNQTLRENNDVSSLFDIIWVSTISNEGIFECNVTFLLIDPFSTTINVTFEASTQTEGNDNEGLSKNNNKIIGGTVGGGSGLAICGAAAYYKKKQLKRPTSVDKDGNDGEINDPEEGMCKMKEQK